MNVNKKRTRFVTSNGLNQTGYLFCRLIIVHFESLNPRIQGWVGAHKPAAASAPIRKTGADETPVFVQLLTPRH